MNDNKGELPSLPATPKPGDYPLRSVASRAAAKIAAKVKRESAEVIQLRIWVVGSPPLDKPILVSRSEGDGTVIEIYRLSEWPDAESMGLGREALLRR